MSNIAEILKAEISRIARKQIKSDTEALRKGLSVYRHEIASLRKRLDALEKQSKRAARHQPELPREVSGAEVQRLRFSATRFAAQRQKLGLSAADFGTLLGVSSLSVYHWEQGKARPRATQLQAIAAARKLGKREVLERLEVMKAAK
jgi:DNA-binding transcriptional regulator YiaG